MQILRAISLFCLALFVLNAQCRVKCVVIPQETTKEKHPTGCPLHEKHTPSDSHTDEKQCKHAPQWDYDDAKKAALVPEIQVWGYFMRVEPLRSVSPPIRFCFRPVLLHLRV